ncbi:MAG: hypothetical protein M1281_13475 [Chloroflexi bacterium]|nr:hypothetical protein [Chloroflexota bacterium]
MKSPTKSQRFYEIRIEGDLGDMWASWFDGLSIRKVVNEDDNQTITELYGPIDDQPALYGVLNKIRDLNLALVSVMRRK